MSNRTLIEINHDFAGDLERHPETLVAMLAFLRSGYWPGHDRRWFARHGIDIITTRHHSEPRKLPESQS